MLLMLSSFEATGLYYKGGLVERQASSLVPLALWPFPLIASGMGFERPFQNLVAIDFGISLR
jgi:hypothetical protein